MPFFPGHSKHAASSTMIRLLSIVFIAGLAACTGTVSRSGSGTTSNNARSAQGAPGDVPAAAPVKKTAAPAAPVQTEARPTAANTTTAAAADHSPSNATDSSQTVQSPPESSAKLDESGAAAGSATAATEATAANDATGNAGATAAAESGASESSAHADASDHAKGAAEESSQPDMQAADAATDANGANLKLKPEAGGVTESGGGAADATTARNAAPASSGNDNAGAAMGATGESATAGANEPAQVASISSDSLGDGGAKLSGATGEGADGLKAGAVAGAEAADASKQPAPKQDTVVGLVDVPGKKATVKEDRIPQTLGGMLPMTLGVDGEGEFDFDKAVVRPEVKGLLDKLAAKLKDSEYDTLDIVGHADRLGTEEYNQSLSERRAWAVARYLIAQGVPLQKIRVEGHGVTEPLTKPEDCAGLSKKDAIVCLQKDRRVEIAASIRNTEVKVQ